MQKQDIVNAIINQEVLKPLYFFLKVITDFNIIVMIEYGPRYRERQ